MEAIFYTFHPGVGWVSHFLFGDISVSLRWEWLTLPGIDLISRQEGIVPAFSVRSFSRRKERSLRLSKDHITFNVRRGQLFLLLSGGIQFFLSHMGIFFLCLLSGEISVHVGVG